jgi:hypothetical protein
MGKLPETPVDPVEVFRAAQARCAAGEWVDAKERPPRPYMCPDDEVLVETGGSVTMGRLVDGIWQCTCTGERLDVVRWAPIRRKT